MARRGDATWHHKKVTLDIEKGWLTLSHMEGMDSMAHNEPCVERNPMAHIKPLECMMS